MHNHNPLLLPPTINRAKRPRTPMIHPRRPREQPRPTPTRRNRIRLEDLKRDVGIGDVGFGVGERVEGCLVRGGEGGYF